MAYPNQKDLCYLCEDRLGLLKQDWNGFRSEHEKIIDTVQAGQEDDEAKIYEDAQAGYLQIRSVIRTRISVVTPKQQAQQAVENKIKVEMQPSEIPNTWGTFAGGRGGCSAWPRFRDCFKVVHENSDLNAAQKFMHSEKALRGDALDLRGHLGATEANYALVWARLIDRYEDDYELIHELVNTMLSLKKLKQASCAGLRHILV